MIFTPAYAQAAGAPAGPSIIEFLLPFVLIFVIMYFLIIRPQQRRLKEHNAMLEALRRGDEVITSGGLIAKITKVKEGEDEIEAEIADGVRVRMVRSTVASVASKTTPETDKKGAKS
ncbi:MAG: preprotein translocase subunit YajC [Pseudomonadota bacterium]